MINNDELQDFDELEVVDTKKESKKSKAKEKEKDAPTKVAIEFPAGTSQKVIESTMNAVSRITNENMEKEQANMAGRIKYMKDGGRRFRCIVESLRPGIEFFEMVIPSPKNPDTPITVRGRCGVIIEDGLTKYTIDRLNENAHFETMEDPNIDWAKPMGLTHKIIKRYNYRVEVFEEVEKPKEVGKVGDSFQQVNSRIEV